MSLCLVSLVALRRENLGTYETLELGCETGRVPAVVLFPELVSSMANGLGDVVSVAWWFLSRARQFFQAKFRMEEGMVFWL